MSFVLSIPSDYSYTHSISTGLKGDNAINNLVITIPGVSGRYFEFLTFTSPNSLTGQWTLGNGKGYTKNTITSAADGSPAKTWTFPYTNQAGGLVEIEAGALCVIRQRQKDGRIYTLDIAYTATKPEVTQ